MGQKVTVELDAEDAKMVAAWQRGKRSVEEFVSEVSSIAPASQSANSSANKLNQTAEALGKQAQKIRNALVTPQTEYAERLRVANQLLQDQLLTEAEYNAEVEKAKVALDAKDEALQDALKTASKLKQAAVTPEQEHAKAIAAAKDALARKLITQKEFDVELKRQNELLQKAKDAEQDLGNSANSTVGQMASAITGIGAGIGIVTAAAMVLKSEYNDLLERQKTAADKQLDTAAAQRTAIFALGEDPETSADKLAAEAQAASQKYGVSLKQVYDAYGNALSARGDLSAKEAISSANTAMQASPHQGSTEIAGSLLGMKRRFGGTDEQMMGLNLAGQQVSRVKDQAAYAQNVVPTIVGLGGYGDSAREATALPTAMSVAMEDLMGRQSATAAEKLAKQLELALPETKTGLKTTAERIRFLWTDAGDKVRKELLGDGKGNKGSLETEAGAYIPTRELLSKGRNKTKDAYAAAMQTLPEMGQADEYYAQAMQRVNGQVIQIQSELDRQHKAAAEFGAMNNVEGAGTHIAREGLEKTLQNAEVPYLERMAIAREMDITDFTGGNTQELAVRKLRERAAKMGGTHTVESNGRYVDMAASPEDQRIADSMNRAADRIQALIEAMDRQKAALNANTTSTDQNTQQKGARRISEPTKPQPAAAVNSGRLN